MKKLIPIILMLIILAACADSGKTEDQKEQKTHKEYNLKGTGQNRCYNNEGDVIVPPAEGQEFYGQDAQTVKVDLSFVNNGNGTVIDNNTNLMWQKTPSKEFYSWQEAVDYCNELELGGFSDWRIPSCKELFSLSDFSVGWPYIDIEYFDLVGKVVTKSEQYWTADFYKVGTTHNGAKSAFGVNHGTGHIKAYPAETPANKPKPNGKRSNSSKSSPNNSDNNNRPSGPPNFGKHIRAVRGDIYGINDFKDNNNGTVTDKATGLMWTQYDLPKSVNWKSALHYADTLHFAGYDDWRLPDVKELQSIVNYSGVLPAIDPLFNCTPIKNEAGDDDYGYYWTSTSAKFNRDGDYNYAWYVAFGRAVGPDGKDSHGAGAVRFDTKAEGGPAGEGGERYYNFVRLVRNENARKLPDRKLEPSEHNKKSNIDNDDKGNLPIKDNGQNVERPRNEDRTSRSRPESGNRNNQMQKGRPDFNAAAEKLGKTETEIKNALGDPRQRPPDFSAAAAELGVTEKELMDALHPDGL